MKSDKTSLEDNMIIGLLLFAPFAFASVHIWAYSLIAVVATVLFNIRFLSDIDLLKKSLSCPTSLVVISFLVINVLYLVPFPEPLVRFLDPTLVKMRHEYLFEVSFLQTFSAYPRATLSYLIKLVSFILFYLVVFSKLVHVPEKRQETVNNDRPRTIYTSFILFGAVMGVLSLLFHSFVDFNLQMPSNALYFTVLLTIIAAIAPSLRGAPKARQSNLNHIFLNKLVSTIIITGFLVGLFGIVQKFSWNGKIFWCVAKPGNNFGPYVNYNHFAGLMEMAIFPAISLFYAGIFLSPLRHMKKMRDKIVWFSSSLANKTLLYLFVSIVMVGALFICSSRGGIISFTISFLIFVIICLGISPKSRKVKALTFSGIVFALFICMIVWLGPEGTISRFLRLKEAIILLSEGKKVLWLLRPCIWIDTVELIKAFPVTGVGLGAYSDIFMPFRTFPTEWGFLRYAHQDYLHLFSELGAIGAGYLIIFLVWYFRRLRDCIVALTVGAEHLESTG